jgi:serine/threonine protein kinase
MSLDSLRLTNSSYLPNSPDDLNTTAVMESEDESVYEPPRTSASYDTIRTIGQGAFGIVEEARVKATGQIVALKTIFVKDPDILKQTEKELVALEEISSPNCFPFVICYYGHYYDAFNRKMIIEMEYIDGKDLDAWSMDYLNKGDFKALYRHLLKLIVDLCGALKYIHGKNIIHRDIKPGNIMITKDGVPKLLDFGLACSTEICPTSNPNFKITCCYSGSGTPIYLAPETALYKENFFVSDVWSLGASIFKAATGNFCFYFKDKKDLESVQIVLQSVAYNEPFILTTPNNKLNLAVNSCLVKNPLQRITVSSLLQLVSSK